MIQFQIVNGLLFLPATVQHASQNVAINFILDTGSAGSAVDVNLVRPDFGRHSSFAEISGVGGSESVLIQKIDKISFGAITLDNISFQFGDLDNSFNVQGILGNNILEKYNATIDYQACVLTLNLHTSN